MSEEKSRLEKGQEMFRRVYGDQVKVPSEEGRGFQTLMIEHLFGEVWTREALSIRDRRLVTMGIIAAIPEPSTFEIQSKAALENKELTPEQLREMVIHLAHYNGYPRTVPILFAVERAIAAFTGAAAGQKTP